VLRSIGAYLLAAVLAVVASNAFRQVPGEFRDAEPGSLLFGMLQVLIGTSAVVAAIGAMRRTRWAAWAIGSAGLGAVALLVAQPFFEPMPEEASRAIWLGAGLVSVVAAGLSWCAHRLARRPVGNRTMAGTSPDANDSPGLLREGQQSAAQVRERRSVSHASPDHPPPSGRS
jgi:hypothetical protein